MSFGFSVGDILAGAQLAYTLSKSLSEAKGASNEYQELIAQLNVVHKVLIHVDELRTANQLAQATVNALLFTINTTNEAIETFLTQYETYEDSLRQGGSGNIVKDVYKKGRWATQMSNKVRDLKGTLSMMLAAVNCLVSLACYYNTGYQPKCTVDIIPSYQEPLRYHSSSWAKDIKLAASIYSDPGNLTLCPGFDKQQAPDSFFRPGQIFSAQIASYMDMESKRGFRKIDFGNLPLEPIPTLKEKAKAESLEDRKKRLAQIRGLPLERMVQYCEDIPHDPGIVNCLLCRAKLRTKNSKRNIGPVPKGLWASLHFRIQHWEHYFSMLPPDVLRGLRKDRRRRLVPSKDLTPPNPGSGFSAEKWIDLTDVTKDVPIQTDEELIRVVNETSTFNHYLRGPVLIQRYSRQGCGDQPDQELFGILHSSDEPPAPMPNETGIVLSPVQMKSDHPSTALSRTARIHYGRAYRISHELPVQSIGLIQDASMEVLLDQFEANVCRTIGDTEDLSDNPIPEPEAEAADINVAKVIRENIASVLGSKMSPDMYQPPTKFDN
ncbi:hypothetical protein Daesc_009902 [Daldinia eschscholtzii]|uniref:DUF6590 domain-containing protein n=1 Tax=Daldinia eschscholtzii TaxID=292717 RepID=A0AAX6M6I1_9PEZI